MNAVNVTSQVEATDLGLMLSSKGRSFCTYVFTVTGGMPARLPGALNDHLATVTGGRSEVFFRDSARTTLVVRIDHALVDAQRGLSLIVAGLTKMHSDERLFQEVPVRSDALEQHWVESVPSEVLTAAAKASGQTATQRALQRIWPAVIDHGVEDIRLIVSKSNTLSSCVDAQTGNHFVPVDVTASAMELMIRKPADAWRRLITRLTKTAERILADATRHDAPRMRDTLTVTSVGSLESIKETLESRGISRMIMYPENVSWCSTVVTIYSLFGQTYFIFSGRGPLAPLLRRLPHDV